MCACVKERDRVVCELGMGRFVCRDAHIVRPLSMENYERRDSSRGQFRQRSMRSFCACRSRKHKKYSQVVSLFALSGSARA
jgi:hypothetical protein